LVVISFLLTVIAGMGGYFIVEVNGRLRAVEVKNPSIEAQITALDAKVDQCVQGLKDKIEASEEHLSAKMDTQYTLLKDLIQGTGQ
jgi:hypothetical protein